MVSPFTLYHNLEVAHKLYVRSKVVIKELENENEIDSKFLEDYEE